MILLPARSALFAAVLLASAPAFATEITVVPADLNGGMNQWNLTNFRGASTGHTSATTAGITTTNAHGGNGSVQMSSTDASGKADYAYTWGFIEGRTLGNLTSASFDWYKSGASSASVFAPAMRLLYDADGSAATTSDIGYLIFEQVYNPNAASVLNDQWISSDLMTANLWQRQLSPGFTVEAYGVSMADWKSGNNQPANATKLGANSAILGIEFGIGSGWAGNFTGFVDNVSFGFGGNVTTFNFEAAQAAVVPEPGSIALLGLGVFGLAVARRRKAR